MYYNIKTNIHYFITNYVGNTVSYFKIFYIKIQNSVLTNYLLYTSTTFHSAAHYMRTQM